MSSSDNIANLGREWRENPEPMKNELDGRTILELDAVSDAYLWESHNSQEGWLSYNGILMPITE
jgi:hypothetical protein